jgi:superfamily II DNA or RNA helicase
MFHIDLGLLGTLDGSNVHELQCRAWFGHIIKSSSTKELMDKGILSNLNISFVSLEYDKEDKQEIKKYNYKDEIRFLINHPKRNDFIVDIACNTDKNTLLLFNYIEQHGDILYEQIIERAKLYNKKIYMITGKVDADERERIRQAMEVEDNVILLASFRYSSYGSQYKKSS